MIHASRRSAVAVLALALIGLVGCSGDPDGGAAGPAAGTVSLGSATPSSTSASAAPTSTTAAPAASASPRTTAAAPTRRAAATTSPTRRSTSPVPAFHSSVRTVTAAELGKSWRAGCPVGPAALRAVTVTYRGFDGAAHRGVIVVHEDIVAATVRVFRSLYSQGFPIRSVRPVSEFGASDDASMAADNTSAFNCRRAVAAGPPSWSNHAYGKAIDINPVENPYLFAGKVLPPAGAAFRSRSQARPGLIRRGDAAQRAFAAAGFRWGARFSSPDYQHFDG